MSNEGPNTNGGRIQFTGNVTITDRDYRNTVFGKIPGAASRQVVDNILLAGSGGTTLLSVKIRRPDSGALAFDEMDVGLPIVSGVEAPLNVRPGKAVDLLFRQPVVSILRTKSSSDLAVWTDGFLNFVGIDEPAAPSFLTIDMASRTKAFCQLSLVKYTESPTAGGASTFAGRTLTADSPGVGQLIYQFDQTGLAGTYENIALPGEPPFFQGDFQVQSLAGSFFGPYSFRLLLYAEGLGNSPFNLLRGGYDSHSLNSSAGRIVVSFLSETMTPVFVDEGHFSISKP